MAGLTIFLSTITIYLYCSNGSITTDIFSKYSDSMYVSDWANLSPSLRKYILMIVQNGQIQLEYSGYGLIQLNLESFANVKNIFNISSWQKKRIFKVNVAISGNAEGREHLCDFSSIILISSTNAHFTELFNLLIYLNHTGQLEVFRIFGNSANKLHICF